MILVRIKYFKMQSLIKMFKEPLFVVVVDGLDLLSFKNNHNVWTLGDPCLILTGITHGGDQVWSKAQLYIF